LIADLLTLAPQITVVASKVAIQFLQNQIHRPFTTQMVKVAIASIWVTHELAFISAPNLHWPDTMLTYDSGTQVLYTCDVFGLHYCDDTLYDETPALLEADFQLYYDCLMGPNARSVLAALKRLEPFPIGQIATGHGPLLGPPISAIGWVATAPGVKPKPRESPLWRSFTPGSTGTAIALPMPWARGCLKLAPL
jgi:flavorubredoxin